jgi:3-oxosteroid 1-dehydrogenase
MHKEMMRIGAWMAQMNEFVGNQMALPPTDPDPAGMQGQICKPHAFLVDQSGQRYMNEGGSYMLFCQQMLERHKTVPAVPSWLIVDSQFMRRYMLCETMPGSKKPQLWWDSKFLRTGKTLEELAAACGLPADALKATTEKFNGFARAGKDTEFGRGDSAYDRFLGDYTHGPNDTLGTVEEGPFFAVEIVPGDVGTYGGVVTDASARVMKPDRTVIEGLYATGTTTAGVMGRAYPGAGCSIGPSFTWGFVAAKHAAGLGNSGV